MAMAPSPPMRDTEALLWTDLDAIMGRDWDAQRHEDRFFNYISDVSYATMGRGGWIELKVGAIPRVGHPLAKDAQPTPGQREWLINRSAHNGGGCFSLARLGGRNGMWLLTPSCSLSDMLTAPWFKSGYPDMHAPYWIWNRAPDRPRLRRVLAGLEGWKP